MDATREKEVAGFQFGARDPVGQALSRSFRELELYGLLSFLLHDDGSGTDPAAISDVAQPKLDQVTAPELAVDSKIE